MTDPLTENQADSSIALPAVTRPALDIVRCRFKFCAETCVELPDYPGSAWRGLFGHMLKRLVCVTREKHCPACRLYHGCPYSYVFETPVPANAGRMRRYTNVPHPFVIIPVSHGRIEKGQIFSVEMVLIGKAVRFLPYVVYAFEKAGSRGIGRGDGRFTLVSVLQHDETAGWQDIYRPGSDLGSCKPVNPVFPALPESFLVHFLTPFRAKRGGKLVTPERFEFSDLFSSLLRRISMLMYFHQDCDLQVDYAKLTRNGRKISLQDKKLEWKAWKRYSSRQQTLMNMDGVTGSITVSGCDLDDFWPYLWLGQWVHAGKATSMGLGQYKITAASLPDRTDSAF